MDELHPAFAGNDASTDNGAGGWVKLAKILGPSRPPTAAENLQKERRKSREKRNASGRSAPVDYLRKSLDKLKSDGYYVERVEWYDAVQQRRHDLFGCVDAIALKPGEPMLAVQATSWANVSARVNKMRASKPLKIWLDCGGVAVVHGWRKGVNGRYEHKEIFINGPLLQN